MKLRSISTLLTFLLMVQYGLAGTVIGLIYIDKNQNGKHDASEKGIANIPVTNGLDVVLTNAKGAFSLSAEAGQSIFPIPPSRYILSAAEPKLPTTASFQWEPSTSIQPYCEFGLVPSAVPSTFKMAVVGDIQVDDEQQITYTNRTFMAERTTHNDVDFNLILGDQVNERPDLVPAVRQMLTQLPSPSRTVYGNHDRLLKDSLPQDAWYRQWFGPSTYAFNYGTVHFLVFNNVQPKGKKGYDGGLTEAQLTFAANDLKYVSSKQRVVVAMHIPFEYTNGKEALLKLLEPYADVLFLSGHMHATGRVFHKNAQGRIYQELVAGAVCGGWWTGERDDQGNPSALMQCGSPRNYYILDVQPNDIRLNFKAIGLDANRQMDVWIQGQDTLDQQVTALKDLPAGTVLVNVFSGSDSTKVAFSIDHGAPISMVLKPQTAPAVARLSALGKANVYPTKNSQRAALRSTSSPHIWAAQLPEHLKPGIHSLRVNAEDRFGCRVEQSVCFSVPE